VSKTGILGVVIPALSAIIMGILIATVVYYIMSKIGFDPANAGSWNGNTFLDRNYKVCL
jgi:hypothetical protein